MKDPAFLFYDGDAARDVSHMNRLERGCYFDIIQAQRKFGRLTIDLIQKILGKEFETCWESVKICLSYDNDMYFIEWLENSTIKRKEYSESRRKNRLSDNQEDKKIISESYVKHMENENENYKYSKFYDSEIENSVGKPDEDNYLKYLKKIYGEIGIYGKMDKILKIKEQLTYDQFLIVLKKAQDINVSLMEMLEKFDNYEGKYKPKTVYRSLLNWLDYESKRNKK